MKKLLTLMLSVCLTALLFSNCTYNLKENFCLILLLCFPAPPALNTHTHTVEYYSAMKKNEIMPLAATWMDLEIIILSEVSQTEKDKYHVISLICGI